MLNKELNCLIFKEAKYFFILYDNESKIIRIRTMVEIKIPTAAAVVLLTQRMQYELGVRQSIGQIDPDTNLKNLTYEELKEIAETSAFDVISLLPADILSEENNLANIVHRAMKSLGVVFEKEEFLYYTEEDARRLLSPLEKLFSTIDEKNSYLVN